MAERALKSVPEQAPELSELPCVRAVLEGPDGAERVIAIDGPTERMLGVCVAIGDPARALVGADGMRNIHWELSHGSPHGGRVSLPARGDAARWVEVRAERRGSYLLLLITDASEDAVSRRRAEVLHRYIGKLSDLSLMFSFSEALDTESLIEVATEATRRMAVAERASFYHVDIISEERLKTRVAHVANAMRVGDRELGGLPLDLGPEAAETIVRLTAGSLVTRREAVWPALQNALSVRGTEVVVFLPVLRSDEVRGLLVLEFSAKDRVVLAEEMELLEAATAMTGATLDRQEAGFALQRSLMFNESVVRAIADGIVVVNSNRRVTMANPSARRLLKSVLPEPLPGGEDLGPATPLIELALDENGEALPAAANPIVCALSGGGDGVSVTLGFMRQGAEEPVWLEVTTRPVPRVTGEPPELVVVCFSDVTARRRHEAEILLARDAALDASRLKGAFLANVSHEIRTPMNGIIGMASLLLETQLESRQREFAITLKGAAETLLGLLDDVLDLSKIEAGRLTIETVELEPVSLIEEVLDILQHSAAAKRLEIRLDVDPALPHRLTGDPLRVRQVLTNLVGNAVKFTHAGHVEVAVALEKRDGAPRFSIRVKDTGIGMTAEQCARVFERFMQADASTTRRFGGTGLGLSISHQLVELMGGTIGVVSAPGAGSEFWFELPTKVVSDVELARDPALAGLRVLVAARDAATRKAALGPLLRWGATPVLLGDVPAGSDRRANVADVVLLDADDEEAIAILRALGRDLPVVTLCRGREALPRTATQLPVRPRSLRRALLEALAPDAAAELPLRRARSAAEARRPCALVVEDQPVNQMVARSMLELLGCDVVVAQDGAQAVQMTAGRRFDLVFMDVQMPDVDGVEATRRIRVRERRGAPGAPVPIVALSASAMKAERDRCLAAGMDGFLSKPVRLEDFSWALDRWVTPTDHALDPGGALSEAAPALRLGEDTARPLLDEGTLERLRRVNVAGESDIVHELVQIFFAEAGERLEAMRRAHRAGDCQALRGGAHSLKGSASTLGALMLADRFLCLEQAARDGDLTAAGPLLDDIEALIAATRAETARLVPGAL